jgi:hypothetical protein
VFFFEILCCVADPDHGSGAFFTSGSRTRDPGWVKSQDLDELPESDFRELTNLFLVKILKFFDADPGSELKKFGSGMENIRIRDRDKHPRPATLILWILAKYCSMDRNSFQKGIRICVSYLDED